MDDIDIHTRADGSVRRKAKNSKRKRMGSRSQNAT